MRTMSTTINNVNTSNIFNVLNVEKRLLKSKDFIVNGEIETSVEKAGKDYFSAYKALCKEIVERGAIFAYMNMHFNNRTNKSTTEKALADVKSLYNKLNIEVSDSETMYTLKQLVNRLNGDKRTDNGKVFGSVLAYDKGAKTPNALKTAFERCIIDISNNIDYATSNIAISNALYSKDVEKLVSVCYELAHKGKNKALDNHFNKLEKLVNNSELFNKFKAEISAELVTVEKATAETPVTTDTPTAETTETTTPAA